MKKVLVEHFPILGRNSYPDDFSQFRGEPEFVTIDGIDYWCMDYKGALDLEDGNTHTYASWQAAINARNFHLTDLLIQDDSPAAITAQLGTYYYKVGRQFTATANIVDSADNLQTDLNVPQISVIATRHAGDTRTDDEIYFDGAIVAGVLTVTGECGESANWKVLAERNNQGLARLGADFRLNFDDIDLVMAR